MSYSDFNPAEKAAKDFAAAMARHHKALLASGDEEVRDAVIVKMVALTTLAFEIPAVDGEPLDLDEAMAKLKGALQVLQRKGASQ